MVKGEETRDKGSHGAMTKRKRAFATMKIRVQEKRKRGPVYREKRGEKNDCIWQLGLYYRSAARRCWSPHGTLSHNTPFENRVTKTSQFLWAFLSNYWEKIYKLYITRMISRFGKEWLERRSNQDTKFTWPIYYFHEAHNNFILEKGQQPINTLISKTKCRYLEN